MKTVGRPTRSKSQAVSYIALEAVEEVVEDCYWQVWRDAYRFDAEESGT